jgi:hypothetical protein
MVYANHMLRVDTYCYPALVLYLWLWREADMLGAAGLQHRRMGIFNAGFLNLLSCDGR